MENKKNRGIDYPFIKGVSIDLNQYCNSKCWFCFNRYIESTSNIMSIDNFKLILNKLLKERGNLIEENWNTIYFHHFNEFLLYPYVEEIFEILRNNKMKTSIFSNGTVLSPKKYNLIKEYKDVVASIMLNVPSIERETWKNNTLLGDNDFDNLIKNLDYINKDKIKTQNITIEVNGLNKKSNFNNGGDVMKMKSFPKNINDDLDYQSKLIKEKYTNIDMFENYCIVDWSSIMEGYDSYSNYFSNLYNNKKDNKRIIDCSCDNRVFNYLDVGPSGDVFLCLNQNKDLVFGNLITNDLSDIWHSDLHKKVLEHETTKGICAKCILAIWDKEEK